MFIYTRRSVFGTVFAVKINAPSPVSYTHLVNGGDVGPVPALADANMSGGTSAGEVEEHDVSRLIIGHLLLLMEGHQSGAVGGLVSAIVQVRSPRLPEAPPDEHGAPGISTARDCSSIVGSVVSVS